MSTFDRLAELAPERVRPLRRVEYERLVEQGLFGDERVELLGGVLVEMSPQSALHAAVIAELTRLFVRAVGDRAIVRVQSPFAVSDDSLPEPDLAIVPLGDHRRAHPTRAHLIVEVSLESLTKDRRLKAELYARAGVPEYWVVNLAERRVEVHTIPREGAYAGVLSVGTDATIRLTALDSVAIVVSAFLA